MNRLESNNNRQTLNYEHNPPILLATLALCLGISDWIGLHILSSSTLVLLIRPQLYGLVFGIISGSGLFLIQLIRKTIRTEIILITKAIYRILLLFIIITISLSVIRDVSPETLLFILGSGLGVLSGLLALTSVFWINLNGLSSSGQYTIK